MEKFQQHNPVIHAENKFRQATEICQPAETQCQQKWQQNKPDLDAQQKASFFVNPL